jgi:hypothetical protein
MESMHDSGLVFLVAAACVIAAGILAWHISRSRTILEQWAQDMNYTILESDFRIFRRGPFFWTTSRGQTVYYVTIRDRQGMKRSGWVRCGGWWTGLFSNKAEVRWDRQE